MGSGLRLEQRAEIVQEFFRQHDRDDDKAAGEQSLNNLGAFGHENALPFLFRRTPHRGVRLQFGQVERGDFFDAEHFEVVAIYKLRVAHGTSCAAVCR